MSEKRTFILAHDIARTRAVRAVEQAPAGYAVEVRKPTRTLEQNAAQWPILEAFAQQRQWPVNGELVWMDSEDWKDVLTAAFHGETVRLAKGINGGVVMLGRRTSKFDKDEFSDWLDFLNATAIEWGIELQRETEEA